MKMKTNLKKVLSVILATSLVVTSSAIAGLAASGSNVKAAVSGLNLMPAPGVTDWTAVNGDKGYMGRNESQGDGSFTFVLKENRPGTTDDAIVGVKMPINRKVNLKENPVLYFDVEGAARFNITVGYQLVENDVVTNPDKYAQLGALYKGSTNNYLPAGTKSSYNLYDYLKARCYSDGSITINYVIFSLAGDKDQTAKFKSCYLAPETSGDWPAVPALSIDVADAPVDMMPASADDITHGNANGDGSYTYENGVLKLVSATGRDSLSWPVNKWVDINELKELNAKIKSENGGFTGLLYTCASDPKDASGMMHYVNDFTGDFGVTAANGYIPAGDYNAMLDIDAFLAAKNWNCAKDTNNVIYIKSALLVAEPGATVTMSGLVFPKSTPATGNPATPDDSYHAWAANSTPEVTNKVNILEKLGLQDGCKITGWTRPALTAFDVDLEKTPYLYYSFEQADTTSFSFGRTGGSPWFMGRDAKMYPDSAKLNTSIDGWGESQYVFGSETGCIDLREVAAGATTQNWKEITFYVGGDKAGTTLNYFFVGDAPTVPTEPSETEPSETDPSVTEPSETDPSVTEPSETKPSDVPGPSTGTAATPDQPYHAWAAEGKPANVTVGTDLLAQAKAKGHASATFNADGSMSYAAPGWSAFSFGAWNDDNNNLVNDIDLENNPYLYWSIEQEADSGMQMGMYTSAAWFTARDGGNTENLLTSNADKFGKVFGSETGCANLYEFLGSDDATLTIKELKFYTAAEGGNVKINYLFVGPAPSTEPTVTEPSVTEPSETEPSVTEPSETEPSVTEPSTPPAGSKTSIISFDPADWSADISENIEIVKGADGSLEISNTDGKWPAAGYALPNGGITFDPAKASLNYDFTVGPDTNIILFFNGATPADPKEGYTKSISAKIDGAELNGEDIVGKGASFKGSFSLNDPDYFPSACYNEDGTMTLTGVRIFAAGEAGSKVVVRELSIEIEGAPTESTDTQPTETDPTETEPTDTQPTDTQPTGTDSSVNTTASSATTATTASTQKDNPKTGDSNALVMVGALLLIVSAGALVLTTKKIGSR